MKTIIQALEEEIPYGDFCKTSDTTCKYFIETKDESAGFCDLSEENIEHTKICDINIPVKKRP